MLHARDKMVSRTINHSWVTIGKIQLFGWGAVSSFKFSVTKYNQNMRNQYGKHSHIIKGISIMLHYYLTFPNNFFDLYLFDIFILLPTFMLLILDVFYKQHIVLKFNLIFN